MPEVRVLLLALLAFAILARETDTFLLVRIRSDEEVVHLGHADSRMVEHGAHVGIRSVMEADIPVETGTRLCCHR